MKTRASSLLAALIFVPLFAGCAAGPSGAESSMDGPVGSMIAASARRNGVPPELMVAIAHVEGGLMLAPTREVDDDDAVPIAGVLELRRGRFNSLARGAELVGRDARELSIDLDLGTEAGARVLDDLAASQGVARGDIASWAPVIEELSGHLYERDRVDYRARVFRALRRGGSIPARGGEVITLAPREDVPVWLTIAPPLKQALDVPEFAGAEWFDTPQANKWTPGREAPISMIAIHDTEGGWDASVSTLQNDPNKSVHYIIDKDGSRVGQFIHEADTAWHAGNWYYNSRMVGIEHVGYSGQDDYSTEMYKTSALLVNDIAARYGLPLDRSTLVGHQEVPNGNNIPQSSPPCPDSPGSCVQNPNYGGSNHHTDPGVYWEWCQYMDIVGGSCKCNDAFKHWNCVHDLSMMVRCPEGKVEIVHCADACVVEPIGVDDHCTPVAPDGSGGGGGAPSGVGGGGDGGKGAASGAGGAGSGNGSGGKDPESGAGSGGSSNDPGNDSSCAVKNIGLGQGTIGLASAAVAAVFLARRRRRPLAS